MNIKQTTYRQQPVQVRLKPELHEWVHQQAQAQERSANWIINKVIEESRLSKQQAQGAVQ